MMTPFPPKTPMQMRREAEHGPPRPTPPLTPQQKREIEAKHPQLGGGSRTSRPAASKCADSCSSPRTFAMDSRARLGVNFVNFGRDERLLIRRNETARRWAEQRERLGYSPLTH